ncbi:Mu-like prophage I protein [Bosea sp. CRIB-10]|uniref:phage protease n=1 Tax=Bosea sp. CRIB-10 TaxID=378404 RepID=UPI0008F33BE3|nr:phage protease [Bosea sp. CRIB-10]SFD79660.1 Mu-like prophage I protein [Bosea sp. CRIB-10]
MDTRTALCDTLPAGLSAGGIVFAVEMATARDGSRTPPEWIQLTPRGQVTARDGRLFRFDPEKLVAAHQAGGIDLPLDFDHETEMAMFSGTKPARGWIVELQARPEGLFGRVDWLPVAVEALSSRSYRYISPTFWREEDGVTARLMKGAALVTSPALSMPAIASASNEDHSMDLKDLLGLLGLAETATAAEASTAIAALKTPDPERFVAKAQHDATVAALSAAQAEIQAGKDAAQLAKCEALIDDAVKGGKVAPAARDHFLSLAKASFDTTKTAIDAMPVLLKAGEKSAGTVEDGDAADPVKLGARARAYMDEQAAKGITISAADAVAHIQGGAA